MPAESFRGTTTNEDGRDGQDGWDGMHATTLRMPSSACKHARIVKVIERIRALREAHARNRALWFVKFREVSNAPTRTGLDLHGSARASSRFFTHPLLAGSGFHETCARRESGLGLTLGALIRENRTTPRA